MRDKRRPARLRFASLAAVALASVVSVRASGEAEDPLPVYELAAKEASALRLSPRDGMLIARRGCLDAAPAPN